MTLQSSNDTLITIFGGSGFLGRHLVRALAKRHYRIRVACRRPDLAGHLQPLGRVGQIHAVQANLRNTASIEAKSPSPSTSTTRPSPASARSHALRSVASSVSRPWSAVSRGMRIRRSGRCVSARSAEARIRHQKGWKLTGHKNLATKCPAFSMS